jgi:hypothetical protein
MATTIENVINAADKLSKDGIPVNISLEDETIKTTARYLLLAIAGGVALGGFFLALFQRVLRTYRP